MPPLKAKKNRIWELDFLRGLAIILVIFDHAMFDFAFFFTAWETSGVALLEWLSQSAIDYLLGDIRKFWRPAFLFLFFFASGLSTGFSRNNFSRSIRLAVVACMVTVVTQLFDMIMDSNVFILFGVLHSLAVIIFFYATLSLLVDGTFALISKSTKRTSNTKIKQYALSALCISLAIVFIFINAKYNVKLRDFCDNGKTIQTDSSILGMFFFAKNWTSADYFPIFPYIIPFFFGAGLTYIIYPNKKSLLPFLDGKWHKPFTLCGKHSLLIYLAGQVVLLAVFGLLSLILIGS